MSDEEIERLLQLLGSLVQRYHDGYPPRNDEEAELYGELRLIDGLMGMVHDGQTLIVPDHIPDEWL